MKKEKDIFDRIMELPVLRIFNEFKLQKLFLGRFGLHKTPRGTFTKKIKKYYYTYSLVA